MTSQKKRFSKIEVAILQAMLALFFWSGSDAFSKLAGQTLAPKIQILTLSSFMGSFVLFLFLAAQKKLTRIKPKRWPLHGINLALILCTGFSGLMSYTLLPLTSVYVILFMSPMLIALFAALFMKEPLTKTQIIAICAGFGGVVIAINPQTLMENTGSWAGYFAAFVFLITFTGLCLMMRIMRKTEQAESITFIGFFSRTLCFLPFYFLNYVPMTGLQILYSCGIGVLAITGNLLMTKAYREAPSATIAPLQYFQILFGAILGYFIWSDRPTLTLILGVFVIISSGVVLLRQNKKLDQFQTKTPIGEGL